jgi:hypothetical protein
MKRIAAAVTGLALLTAPTVALASGNSTKQQYSPKVSAVQDTTASRTPSTVSPSGSTQAVNSASGQLPFTGLDVGALAGGGLVLLGGGLVLRRSTRH